jgi:hypothetical protein
MVLTTPAIVSVPPPLPQDAAGHASEAVTGERYAPTPTAGLKAFVSRWEMNDFLFMLLVENLRPAAHDSQTPNVWFAVTPNTWREALILPIATALNTDPSTTAFLLTRIVTTCVFLAIALMLARRVYRHGNATALAEAAFLMLAWLWLLSPTQNPWYWIWALPLLPFARGRAWFAMSGIVMLYYLRFLLRYQFAEGPICGTNYNGAQFFDFVVTWLEYAPWFAWLGIAAIRRRQFGINNPNARLESVGGFTDAKNESTYHSDRNS